MADECIVEKKENRADPKTAVCIKKAKGDMFWSIGQQNHMNPLITFDEFLLTLVSDPKNVLRNIFQVFHDMVKYYVGEGVDEYPDDPESIHYVYYDCSKLLVENADHPFFADRLFANRLVKLVEALKKGAQQNKIYLFKGPPGCGKSTFFNNLLMKMEDYANTDFGMRHETVWRIKREMLGGLADANNPPVLVQLAKLLNADDSPEDFDLNDVYLNGDDIELPCPSHDSPILMIPKHYRREFLDEVLKNDKFKYQLSTEKEYEWVFSDVSCTICSSLYDALLKKMKSPQKVFEMICARPYRFNRRMGEGITVFNPGDKPLKQNVLSNKILQNRIDRLLKSSGEVRYLFSTYAKTNNGVYALMDIKSHNTERLIELHNIVSEGTHKVEYMEESVSSLLLGVMNPEDQKNIEGFKSFLDRVEYIKIPYVLDFTTEVEIYRNIFGQHIDEFFLPRVLFNFARVIVFTRMNEESDAMKDWIKDADSYKLYCDEKLQLLKMEIYTGYIPTWLSEKDRKRLTAKRRRKIISESEQEGDHGISGRDSITLFDKFLSTFKKEGKLISMAELQQFFTKSNMAWKILKKEAVAGKDLGKYKKKFLPGAFLNSLLRMYDYTILQEVKECLYYYNEQEIDTNIKHYLFAVNFEIGSTEVCNYTGIKLEITEDFLENLENRILGEKADKNQRKAFRDETQKEYASKTLTQEMMIDSLDVSETKIYSEIKEKCVTNLKQKVLDPFIKNENFRRAIKDFGTDDFKTYDKKIREEVVYLFENMEKKYKYTQQGAKEMCVYVLDNDLVKKFADN